MPRASFPAPLHSASRDLVLLLAVTGVIANLARPATANDASAPAKEPWTVDSIVFQERTAGWTLSPDGSFAVWLKRTADEKRDKITAQLMLTDLQSGESRRLTREDDDTQAPLVSPSGKRIAFLSSRALPETGGDPLDEKEKGPQLWLLDLRGGDAESLTRIPYGVGAFRWQNDDAIVLTTRERPTQLERAHRERKDDTRVVEDTDLFRSEARHLFRLSLADKKLARIAGQKGGVTDFEISPDGHWLVALHAQSPSFTAEGDVPPQCFLHDLVGGAQHELFADRKSKPRQFAWRPDSHGFYAAYPQGTVDGEDSGAILVLKEVDAATREVRDVNLDWPRGLTEGPIATADGFIALLADGVRPRVTRYRREVGGYAKQELTGPHAGKIIQLAKAQSADTVLYVTGGASDPDHVVVATLRGSELADPREIYRPNGGFAQLPIARTEVIRFRGALDEEIEGLIYYPHNYTEGKKFPLVLMTHGGPHGADADRFIENWGLSPNIYCQRGAFVLRVNYHGSSDYGLAFGESIKGRYYELEVKDLFAGIQHLVDRGLVDRERMGLVGWSNGAILSIAALSLAHLYAPEYDWQFRACAPGAGDANWSSDYGNCEFGPVFDNFYLGGPPWQLPEVYTKKSPLFHVKHVQTPTIIFFGTEDTAVPTEQGWEWYRALHMVKQAPVKFLLFPGEEHSLSKPSHQRRKLIEELAWFDHYLFDQPAQENPALKAGSPLEVALRKAQYPSQAGALGELKNGKLLPECVDLGNLVVSRFEITRGQWRAFRPETMVAAGTENYPVTGITADDAQAYVRWLSEQTGDKWRLLTIKEHERLRGERGGNENDLDSWAGYPPPPAEAAPLAAELRKLPIDTVLEPVGSRAPGVHRRGDERVFVFDAAGNAAEWVTDESGQVVASGGCAVLASDDRGPPGEIPAEYIGLRVVREASKP